MRFGVAAALAIVLAAGVAPAGSATRSPVVRVVSMDPLVVRGARFRPHERVTVTYYGAVRRARRIVASRTGSFKVRFGDVTVDPCSAFSIVAVGASGHGVSLRHKPLPACAPA